jgi:hypothetical protein
LWVAGLDAVEFIANHAEIAIAFVQESKLPLVCKDKIIHLICIQSCLFVITLLASAELLQCEAFMSALDQ